MLQCYNVTMFYMHFLLLMRGQASVRGGTYKCAVFPQRRAKNIQDQLCYLSLHALTQVGRHKSVLFI